MLLAYLKKNIYFEEDQWRGLRNPCFWFLLPWRYFVRCTQYFLCCGYNLISLIFTLDKLSRSILYKITLRQTFSKALAILTNVCACWRASMLSTIHFVTLL